MRWLAICLVLITASEVGAELVIDEPPMVRRCSRAKTWDAVNTCLAKYNSTAKVIKQWRGVKLLTMFQKQGGKDIDMGLLLYVERNGNWQLGGRLETYGAPYQLIKFEQVTVGSKTGFRLDIAQESTISMMVDSLTPVAAQLRTRRSLFCGGENYYCPEAMARCEVDVDGRTWHLFRGTFEYEENAVNIKGDRTRGGVHCNVTTKIHLGWR